MSQIEHGLFRVETKGQSTRVFNVKTGEELTNVVRVEFTHDGKDGPKLLVTQADWVPEVTISPDAQQNPDPSPSHGDRTEGRS